MHSEKLQMVRCLKSRYKRPVIIFSAFLIPEDIQKELQSAGADRVNVGWPITQDEFREYVRQGIGKALPRSAHLGNS
jgi:hypothetical protein